MNIPSVSVIIPNLNMAAYLPDAIASIRRQAHPVKEIIIVDAGSSDNSLDLIEGLSASYPEIRLLHSTDKNPSGVRNRGLEAASGEIISFLDADDLWPADKLERQLARLAAGPEVSVVSGFVQYFDVLDPETLSPASHSRTETLFHVHLGAAIFRYSILEKIGLFNESLRYSEDVDFLLRIREEEIPMTILRARTLYYRRHDASLMAQTDPAKDQDFKRTLFASLMRRRNKGITTPMPPFESLIEPETQPIQATESN